MKNETLAMLLIEGIGILKEIHKQNLEENRIIENFLKMVNVELGADEEEKKDEPKKKKESEEEKKKAEKEKSELEMLKEAMEKLREASKIEPTDWITVPYVPPVMPIKPTDISDWGDSATVYSGTATTEPVAEEEVAVAEPDKMELPEEETPDWKEGVTGGAVEGMTDSEEKDISGGGHAGKIWCAVCNEWHDKETETTSHVPPSESPF
jgi:hypothetical protein